MTRQDVRDAYALEKELAAIYLVEFEADLRGDKAKTAEALQDAKLTADWYFEEFTLYDAELLADELAYLLGDECDDRLNSLLNCIDYAKELRKEVQDRYNEEREGEDAPYTLRDFLFEEHRGGCYGY